MHLTHDPQADAIYIDLRPEPYAWGHDLDTERRVDFGTDNKPIGIELLNVSLGVDVEGLPDQDAVTALLLNHGVKLLAPVRTA